MTRVLMIDPDRATRETLGLACLEREVGVVFADTVCEGVRVLLGTHVDLVVIDGGVLRLTPRELSALFARIAPEVPVAVALRPQALETRVALELAGFRVLPRPVTAEDLLRKVVLVS